MLYESMQSHIADYSTNRLIPYQDARNLKYWERKLPIIVRKRYLIVKYWNSDERKARYLFVLLKSSNKYNKVKLHKGCVYVTRRI